MSRRNYTCLDSSKSDSSDIAQRLVGGARDDQLSYEIVMLNHRDKPRLCVLGRGNKNTWPTEKWLRHS
jgi:hypothetical protein